jgi:lactoylglutathione lyase
MELDHIAIYVTDMARSEAFYEHVLGFERIPEPFHDGVHTWFRVGPHLSLHVVGIASQGATHPIANHIAFRSRSLDAVMARLDAQGVVYRSFNGEAKVNVRPDGIRQIYFQDPDGYWLEVNEDAV